jgi:hypothetical protein
VNLACAGGEQRSGTKPMDIQTLWRTVRAPVPLGAAGRGKTIKQ